MKYLKRLLAHELPVKSSPWGKPDGGALLAEGITSINTPGHGGIHLSRARQRLMPDYFKAECADGSFYEEDCCWCVVGIVFPEAFDEAGQTAAKDTLRNWFPALYERHYGVTLQPGESSKKDEQTFERETADKYTVRAAWGDWEETTPEGFVTVCATRKADGPNAPEKHFLIPSAEYVNPSRIVCDGYPPREAPTGRSRAA